MAEILKGRSKFNKRLITCSECELLCLKRKSNKDSIDITNPDLCCICGKRVTKCKLCQFREKNHDTR